MTMRTAFAACLLSYTAAALAVFWRGGLRTARQG
jgi:hypothetical protein